MQTNMGMAPIGVPDDLIQAHVAPVVPKPLDDIPVVATAGVGGLPVYRRFPWLVVEGSTGTRTSNGIVDRERAVSAVDLEGAKHLAERSQYRPREPMEPLFGLERELVG